MAGNTLTISVALTLLDQMSGRVQAAVQASKSSLDKFSEHAKRVGDQLTSFGLKAGAIGAAMGAGVVASSKAFAEVEDAAAKLKATMTGTNGLSENFQAVSDLAVRLGNELPGTTRDFYAMNEALLQLGVTEEDVLGGVGEAAAKLAVVMQLPFEEAAQIAAKLKEAAGVANEDMLAFMDTLQRVGHQGVEAGQMMAAFAKSGGALKQFGLQGEEAARSVGTLFAQLIKAGATGETVGTGFASILNNLSRFEGQTTTAAKQASATLRSMGVELDFFDDQTKQFKGVEHMVREFDKLQGLDPIALTAVLQKVFGTGQDAGFVAQLIQGGSEANAAMTGALARQADLQTRAAVQLDTLSSKWEAATGNFTNLLAKFGEQSAGPLGGLVDELGGAAAWMGEWMEKNQGPAQAIGQTFTVLAGAFSALGATGLAIGQVTKGLSGLASGFSLIASAWTMAGPALIALATNPIVLAILGIGAVAYAGWKWGPELVAGAQKVLTDLANVIKTKVDQAKKAITDTVTAWKAAGEAIIQGLLDGIKAKATAVVDRVKQMGNDIVKGVKDLLQIRSPSQVMFQAGLDTARGFELGIAAGIPGVREQGEQLAEVVAVAPAGRMRNADGTFKSAADAERQGTGIMGGLREYSDMIISMNDQIKNFTVRTFTGMEDALVQFVRKGKLDFSSLVDSMLNDLIRLSVQAATRSIFGSIAGGFGGFFGGFAQGAAFEGFATGGSFTNSVVRRPTAFPMGLMGEAGPEAIMPLTRAPDGSLGVRAAGAGGGFTGNVIVNVTQSQDGQTHVSANMEGSNLIVDAAIAMVEGRLATNVARGEGALASAMERSYGLNRAAGSY